MIASTYEKGQKQPSSHSCTELSKTSKFEWTLDNIRIEKIISAPIWLTEKFFSEVSALLDVRHCPKLQSCEYQGKLIPANTQRWYMSKQRRDVGQRDIYVGSTSIKINVDTTLTLKTILFLYHDAWKTKVFILRLRRVVYNGATQYTF